MLGLLDHGVCGVRREWVEGEGEERGEEEDAGRRCGKLMARFSKEETLVDLRVCEEVEYK